MPKASTRFRNRKINFRTRIPIRTGPIDLTSDQEEDDFAFEDDRRQSLGGPAGERGAVETGVDKEEESELHLQKVINASTAALLRSAVNERLPASTGVLSEAANAAAQSSTATHAAEKNEEANVPHIPIPDATGLADPAAYEALYGHSKIFLPSSYIRFSDTVEDMLGGVTYTMDEEDQIWLSNFNAEHTQSNELNKAHSSSTPDESAKARRVNGRKGKEKERVSSETEEGLGPLSEDDFEALMDHFEKTTEETVPGLHLDTNRLPSLADLEHTFEGALIPPRLSSIKIFAKFVYSHWKERRLKRGGKPIIPAIDFDETNENNPYVCFRRREIKMVRKTRRTDAQNMDRLIRLRNDLHKAQELLNTVVTRERVKREAVELEKAIFEGRCLIREMKRSLKEADGDEDLLVSKKEKRRKREESGNGTLKSPLRKSAGLGQNGLASGEAIVHDDVQFSREQARASARLMDRDFNRCREEQSGWEDLTDSCYLPMAPSAAALRWRGALCPDSASAPRAVREGTPSFEQGLAMSPSVMEHNQFRKRVGRGGRFLLDRIIAPRRRTWTSTRLLQDLPPQSEEAIRRRKLADRWRYDDDLKNDFPDIDDPLIIDDYSLTYSSRRRNLLDLDDLDCLEPHSETYLSRVSEFLGRAPEPEPPIMKIGKLPGKAAAPNFGPGLGRTNLPVISPASLQEQIMSGGQGSLQSQGPRLNQAAARRIASGPSVTNAGGTTQVMPRIRMNPPATPTGNSTAGSAAPVTHGQGSPQGQQSLHPLIAFGWPNGSSVAPSVSGPSSTTSASGVVGGVSPNRVPSPQHAQLANQMVGSYSANTHSAGLSRSIPVPANGSPASRGMNGITITNILSANPMVSSHSAPRPSSSGSGGTQHQPTPFISRPGSASSPPASHQVAPRNPSPNTIQVKVSPGPRSVKRPASSLGQHQSPPPGSIINHLLNCNPPSPSPPTVSIAQGHATQHQSGPAGSHPAVSSPPHGGSTALGKTPVKGQMMHHASHSPLHLVHGHPVSPHHGIPGNVFNPMFGHHHQSSPSQSGQNGANGTSGAAAGGVPG